MDDSVAIVGAWAKTYPRVSVRVLENSTNAGFAPAVNQAIEVSSQPLVCLLNPDVRLLPDTMARLTEALERLPNDVSVVGAKLLRASGDDLDPTPLIDSAGMVMTRDGRHFDPGSGLSDETAGSTPRRMYSGSPAHWHSSAAMPSRRAAWMGRSSTRTSSPTARTPTSPGACRASAIALGMYRARSPTTAARSRQNVAARCQQRINYHSVNEPGLAADPSRRSVSGSSASDSAAWYGMSWSLEHALTIERSSMPAFRPGCGRIEKPTCSGDERLLARRRVRHPPLHEWFE